MFAQLPETLKKQVIYYLDRDNFIEAKAIYDTWISSQNLDFTCYDSQNEQN